MTSKSEKRGSYIAKFLKQGDYLQQTENVNVKKRKKKRKGFHVPAVDGRVFLHTLTTVSSPFPFTIWSQTDPLWGPCSSDHRGAPFFFVFLIWFRVFLAGSFSRTDLHLQVSQEATWWINSGDLLPPVPFVSISPPLLRQCGWRTTKETADSSLGLFCTDIFPRADLCLIPFQPIATTRSVSSARKTSIAPAGTNHLQLTNTLALLETLSSAHYFFSLSMVLLWSRLMVIFF